VTPEAAPLALRDVWKGYEREGERVDVLRGVSFEVREREFVVVRGRSGSGKSTLLHLMGLMDGPERGVVLHRGHDHHGEPEDAQARVRLRGLGFVFQRCHLVPTLTAAKNVGLPMKAAGVGQAAREARIRALFEDIGLRDRGDHYPHQLSGGQQQMVAVARALANGPYLVLADEPTGNLDPESGGRVIDLLHRVNRDRGAAVVLVTHAPGTAPPGARHLELADGRLSPR
jgi:putative ABC transport system ATP-binding protein